MPVYLSHSTLRRWSDPKSLAEGEAYYVRGAVSELTFEGPMARALVNVGGRPVRTRFLILADGSVESHCPCQFTQERGLVCVHVLAAGFLVAHLTEDPIRERAARIATRRRAEGRSGRAMFNAAGTIPATVRLRLDVDLLAGWAADAIVIASQVLYQDQKRRLDKLSTDLPLQFSDRDLDLLYVLGDLAGGSNLPGSLTLSRERFLELVAAVAPREIHLLDGATTLQVGTEWQLAALHVSLIPEAGTIQVQHRMESPVSAYLPGRRAVWALMGNRLEPVEGVLPESLKDVYRNGTTIISRERVIHFLRNELPTCEKEFLVESTVSEADFHFETGQPTFVLELDGSAELLIVRLWADYGGGRVRAGYLDPNDMATFPLPGHPMKHVLRNVSAEEDALAWLLTHKGLAAEGSGVKSIAGVEQVLGVMSDVVPLVQARGWQVHTIGAMERLVESAGWVLPSVTIMPATAPGWFDVEVVYRDAQGNSISPSLVDAALDAGRSSVEQNGRLLLANRALLGALRMACVECMDAEGDMLAGRVSEVHAGYFSSMLAMHPGITVTAHADWHARVRRQMEKSGLEEVEIPDPLGVLMRPYQRAGVNWLRYLEQGGFAGILADEMGLGKTIQTLAWLNLERISPSARGLPSLVVCPTSLMHNWAREAARFTPDLRVRVVTGADRHRDWDTLASHDLIVTSYALLRRDIGLYQDQQFSAAVLDEAQHIKNRSTQNAQAARQIKAVHRLVLTGTPMENAVSDLWSIMEFLMPGYLGSPGFFRESYERPVSAGGKAAEDAVRRLRSKIQPFMLRRLKSVVAAELPPRLTRVATCVMGAKQAELYRKLVDESRESLTAMVAEKGYNASRLTVLKTLMRLRQLCCHPALLKLAVEDDEATSAKMELFFELLDEAMDGGQRVLVFSQFVQMLQILRRELDARGLRYAYLDGATRDRQGEVDRFQSDNTCPVFLISLKAGGSGLNLTGANVVIHFDPWWNPAVEDQATDRAHRIGQTRSVYSIKLVTVGTVEEQVLELQARKRQVIDAMVGGGSEHLQSLSWEDVQHLLAR